MILLLFVLSSLAFDNVVIRSYEGGKALASSGNGDAVVDDRPSATMSLHLRVGEKVYLKDVGANTILSKYYGKPKFVPYDPSDRSNLLEIIMHGPGIYKIRSGEACLAKGLGSSAAWNICSTSTSQLWRISFTEKRQEKIDHSAVERINSVMGTFVDGIEELCSLEVSSSRDSECESESTQS